MVLYVDGIPRFLAAVAAAGEAKFTPEFQGHAVCNGGHLLPRAVFTREPSAFYFSRGLIFLLGTLGRFFS